MQESGIIKTLFFCNNLWRELSAFSNLSRPSISLCAMFLHSFVKRNYVRVDTSIFDTRLFGKERKPSTTEWDKMVAVHEKI